MYGTNFPPPNPQVQYYAKQYGLHDCFFQNPQSAQLPQLYPIVSGVDPSFIQQKIQRRTQASTSHLQPQNQFSPQQTGFTQYAGTQSNIPSSANIQPSSPASPTAVPQVSYPKVEEIDYYYQKFYSSNSQWLTTSLRFNPWEAQSWQRPPAQPTNDDMNHLYPVISMPPPTPVIDIEEFQKLRHHSSVESALGQLNGLSKCLNGTNPESLPARMVRACFICCNSYTKESLKLGVGPVNDSVTVAANHKYLGYKVYYVHNPMATQFLSFLKVFLQRTTEFLTVFYTGHGSNMKNYDGTEESGYDQCMVFDDDYVKDDTLSQYLRDYSTGIAKTMLITDCCHSGTIWDIPDDPVKALEFPANIVSVSSSDDDNTAKQGTIDNNSQGLFTFYFWKTLKEHPEYNLLQVKPLVDKAIKKYKQECILHATRPNILETPFFAPR